MALTELKIQKLKPHEKRYFLADGHGLYIAVMPTGENTGMSGLVRMAVNVKNH